MTSGQNHAAIAYGCHWQSAFPLSLFQTVGPQDGEGEITVSLAASPAPPRRSNLARGRLQICDDGLRFSDDDGTILDLYGTDRIDITPATNWLEKPPASLYGTVTAAMLASRGILAMHGSAVEVDGRAILICGSSGAGKSTLAASLVAAGARLISDDLSAVHLGHPADRPAMYAGRRAIRLFPAIAGRVAAAVATELLPGESHGKSLVMVPATEPTTPWPLAAVLLLGPTHSFSQREATLLALLEHSYRRRALSHFPQRARRLEIARAVVAQVPVLIFPPVEARDENSFQRVAQEALRACDRAVEIFSGLPNEF